ncbi:MAG: YceI family protein [Chitinophagales bacterium]
MLAVTPSMIIDRTYICSGFFALMIVLCSYVNHDERIFSCNKGSVSFLSDAPLESIKAASQELKGAIAASNRTFLFSVDVNSFHGFNSALQQEHFNENYLETTIYPKVSFQGKFIEEINFNTNGIYQMRAKGMLDIHGVKQERIINGTMTINGDAVIIDAQFTVLLEDHDIRIPKVVHQKISPEIMVSIHAQLKPVTAPK